MKNGSQPSTGSHLLILQDEEDGYTEMQLIPSLNRGIMIIYTYNTILPITNTVGGHERYTYPMKKTVVRKEQKLVSGRRREAFRKLAASPGGSCISHTGAILRLIMTENTLFLKKSLKTKTARHEMSRCLPWFLEERWEPAPKSRQSTYMTEPRPANARSQTDKNTTPHTMHIYYQQGFLTTKKVS